MTWDTEHFLPNTKHSRHFERQQTKVVMALRREITHLNQERRYKMWHLDHDRKQFEKKHPVLNETKQKKTAERTKLKNETNLLTSSLDGYVRRWLSSGFHDKDVEHTEEKEAGRWRSSGSVSLDVSLSRADDKINDDILPRQDSSGSRNHTDLPAELPLTYVSGGSAGRSVTKQPSIGSALPVIVVTPTKEGSGVSRRTSDSFVPKVNEDETEHSTSVTSKFHASPRNSIVSTRKLSIDVPPRLRSTSLPVISNSVRYKLDPSLSRDRSHSIDTPRPMHFRQEADSHLVIQNSVRTSNGVSKSKVIGDLSRGIMYRDLDERQQTVISDEQWSEVRKCRYLRGHDPDP